MGTDLLNDHRLSSAFLPGMVGSEDPINPFSMSCRIEAASLEVDRSVEGSVYMLIADMFCSSSARHWNGLMVMTDRCSLSDSINGSFMQSSDSDSDNKQWMIRYSNTRSVSVGYE